MILFVCLLRIVSTCHDDASKFVRLLAMHDKRDYLVSDDFVPLVQVWTENNKFYISSYFL